MPAPPARVLLAAAVLAACSSPPPSRPRPPAAAAESVARADSLFFQNSYTAAEAMYRSLIGRQPGDAGGRAAYALFLTYRHDYDGARSQARRAVGSAPRDGRAEAILCRVEDWAERLGEAVAAGRRGAALSPRDPLTHLFLAEALADDGDAEEAAAELARAAGLVTPTSPPFVRAELHRERANVQRDGGDVHGQVAELESARAEQPQWVERVVELADAYQVAQEPPSARAVLDSILPALPSDPEALEVLGRPALIDADYPAARAIWGRALAAEPGNAAVLDANAQVAMALDGSADEAERLLVAALGRNRGDAEAAAYLLAIARYVRGDEARGRQLLSGATVDSDALRARDEETALRVVNAIRAQTGLPPARLDPRLGQSAQAHSYYWLFNNGSPSVALLGIHGETEGTPGYRGVHPWDRALAWGYPTSRIAEDITHRGNPVLAVLDWVSSVYHRFPILRPDLETVGFGEAALGPLRMEDMEFGFSPPASAVPAVYPADGQVGVPPLFVDNELPDPLPAGTSRISGYPVTVTFSVSSSVRLSSFTLTDAAGAPVDAYVIPPERGPDNSASLLATARLASGQRFSAHIVATVDGDRYERAWSFTTA